MEFSLFHLYRYNILEMTVQFTVQNVGQRLYFLKNSKDLLILLTTPEKIISLCIYSPFISIIYITAGIEKQAIKESNSIITYQYMYILQLYSIAASFS